MVRDRIFFGCFTPDRSPQSSSEDVKKVCQRTNESLHCTDYEIICDRNFFGCFTPGGSPQSLSYDVTASYDVTSENNVIIQIFGASAGGKATEKISVTYHFVISAMQAFVCTKFHVVPRKDTLAYLCDVITRTLGASVGGKAAENNSGTYHFVIWSI